MPDVGRVIAVARSSEHRFSKDVLKQIEIVEGLGVAGDCHSGETVKHRSRVARDPSQPNLRQVHLIHPELFDEVVAHSHLVQPGDLGENITTEGIDLLGLPTDSLLHIGERVILRLTGLRNPCHQIDDFQPGLLRHMVSKQPDGTLVRKAGVMSVVVRGGVVRVGDAISVELPSTAHQALQPV